MAKSKNQKILMNEKLSPEKEAEFNLKMAKIMVSADWVPILIVRVTKTIIILGSFYFVFLMINSLAGQTTIANIFLAIIADINYKDSIFLILGLSGWIFGIFQMKLRRKDIKRLSEKNDRLEKIVNPNKTSSYITTEGRTNKEDKKWGV